MNAFCFIEAASAVSSGAIDTDSDVVKLSVIFSYPSVQTPLFDNTPSRDQLSQSIICRENPTFDKILLHYREDGVETGSEISSHNSRPLTIGDLQGIYTHHVAELNFYVGNMESIPAFFTHTKTFIDDHFIALMNLYGQRYDEAQQISILRRLVCEQSFSSYFHTILQDPSFASQSFPSVRSINFSLLSFYNENAIRNIMTFINAFPNLDTLTFKVLANQANKWLVISDSDEHAVQNFFSVLQQECNYANGNIKVGFEIQEFLI